VIRRAALTALGVVLLAAIGSASTVVGSPGSTQPLPPAGRAAASPIPFLAYYYIWFDKSSWNRAKSDVPTLGPYSSDDVAVMRQHIRWAKASGITGFIVSWKSTPTLDRRLQTLMQVAKEEDFKLAIIYQGLDFNRHPLPIARVAADLQRFRDHFAPDPVFKIFEKPLVIISGTWAFSTSDIESVTTTLRSSLLVLGSEKNVADYQRIQQLVDGDAYYWSSVNPDTFAKYQGKLDDFSAAVHGAHGLWIAPAAPGFDGTLLGHVTVVDRKDGDTLRREVNAALKSGPDAVGLISWNEFSENSYIEPSQQFGDRYLQVMSQITQLPTPTTDPLGSSDDQTGGPPPALDLRLVIVGVLVAAVILVPIALSRARRRRRGAGQS
jgi:hypothetical protein